MSSILILNGVNLGSLGSRRPDVYGTGTLADIEDNLRHEFPDENLDFRQTDYEGELIGWVHGSAAFDGLVINPGAWSHYSYALHDALESVNIPKVEVHLSNIHSRDEGWRRVSAISPVVDAVVAGMGAYGYRIAVGYVIRRGGVGWSERS